MSSRKTSGIRQVAAVEPVKITFDQSKGLFKKCIGRKRGADGKLRPRIFWLGERQDAAVQKAIVLRDVWQELERTRPEPVWDDTAERYAEKALHERTVNARVLAGYAQDLLRDLGSFAPIALAPAPVAPLVQQARLAAAGEVTITDLVSKYSEHAEGYYRRPDGRPTDETKSIRMATVVLTTIHGNAAVKDFGPLALKAVRQAMIKKGWCRSFTNQQIGRLKRMFKWGVENELVPASVFHGIEAVAGLRKGRSDARESEPVKPVPVEHVEAVRPFVSSQVQSMIDLQLLTGMRPGEVCIMRSRDIERAGKMWMYKPAFHKTEHHGHSREIYLGPKAQELLTPYLDSHKPDQYLFSPAEAEKERRAEQHDARETPLSCGNRPGKRSGGLTKGRTRAPGERYNVSTYRRAIARACRKADAEAHKKTPKLKGDVAVLPAWHPHQLRHNAATRLRKQYGLEAARVVLGHRSAAVAEIYAEIDHDKARDIMAVVG